MKILVVDCYDSFTYNLVHYLEQMCSSVTCIRNDKIDIDSLDKYNGIVISPGPGLPNETKNLYAIIEKWAPTKPILGICLGHQAIGTFYGLELQNMLEVHHGIDKNTLVVDRTEILFKGISKRFLSGRYHSWVLKQNYNDSPLKITSIDSNKNIMGISHKKYNVKGIQFHPESILTPQGFKILKNWVISLSN